MKVLIEVDDLGNGYYNLKDLNGIEFCSNWQIGTNILVPYTDDDKSKLKQVLKLKDAGFTAEEIIEMKDKELL